ncbi:MAG TPA: glycoside hydrolase family 30 protein [Kiritimatiellia bacterium]|nr:glycoside hydrolase family 30 protein [Kiritimatiellia bacterium]
MVNRTVILVALALSGASLSAAPVLVLYETARDTDLRLSRVSAPAWTNVEPPLMKVPAVFVDTKPRFQTIVGFGGALTDAAAETFYKLPAEAQAEILTAYYDPEAGIGYTLGRTHINSCDFSTSSYAYAEVDGDVALEHFSIERDRRHRIPLIKAALAKTGGTLKLFASPWSPPAWMKTNGSMLLGGSLRPEYYESWASYYVRFFAEYEKEGIPFWGLTVQNEPGAGPRWESCMYTAEQERDFVRDHLGPALARSPYRDHKLMVWDHNRGYLYQRAMTVLDDPEAARYVWGVGFHWYGGDAYGNMRLVGDVYPDKHLMFTEGCITKFDPARLGEWEMGERYGKAIVNDLNSGAVGWTDWNILLDETGGPNHVSNFCFAPIIGDTRTGALTYMNSYHYMGHFSKFIRPGAQRVAAASNKDALLVTAFRNPDGTVATVLLNTGDEAMEVYFTLDGRRTYIASKPRSVLTVVAREQP